MASVQNNLFMRLRKWAVRQDENFLTETFAYLLEYLAENEPEAAAEIVARVTGAIVMLSPQQIRGLIIRTQISGDEGIPDIELRTAEHFVIIEVKSEAEVTENQLGRYRRVLQASEVDSKGLVLLTRYPTSVPGADHYFRWYQVAEWIHQEASKYRFKAVSQFLVDQFLGFMKARNMTMSQITWELPTGVRSMRALADMLYEAAVACQLKAQIRGNSYWIGIHVDGRQYWAGISFFAPERLVFGTDYAPVDSEAAEALGVGSNGRMAGQTRSRMVARNRPRIGRIHFFARSKASQMQFLEQFLRENYDLAKKITVPGTTDAGPSAEDSQE